MDEALTGVEIRWSDLDPNFHLRHSVYYDFGAFSRISFFTQNGITPEVMSQHNIGPILFREECVFRKEIVFGDKVTLNMKLDKITKDFSRWTIVHEIFKNDTQRAAIITVDGAWLDTTKRKLTLPPPLFNAAYTSLSKTSTFQVI